ncbi:MAG: hypothetical protein KBD51_03635 [Candidatus Levybacteria bacterium]|nr:hypothetical protein [Candidatus Levybacteria bacterium]
MKIKKILLGLLSLSLFVNPYLAYADEISVSGNGEGSTNNVNISQSNNNTTTQENTAEINNNVEVNANTGNNTASENNGEEVNITTGDVDVDTTIINTGINQSYAENDCCQGDLAMNITGNSSGSNNGINYSSNVNNSVSVNNNANISNNVNGYANTGYNSANKNSGDVSINTGSIKVVDTIKNNSINIHEVHTSNGTPGDVSIKIADNGADSDNNIAFVNDSSVQIDVNNSANIVNNSSWELNTGGNEANKNSGDVEITTGDILLATTIENTNINVGLVDVDCCNENPTTPPDGTPPTPVNPVNPGPVNDGGGSGGTSSNGGSVLDAILPVTGDYFMILMMIGNIALFFLGGYLRLRSGRAPNYLFAR